MKRRDHPDQQDEPDHGEDQDRAGPTRTARAGEIHWRKVEHAGVLGTEVGVALVESRVDSIGQQERPASSSWSAWTNTSTFAGRG